MDEAKAFEAAHRDRTPWASRLLAAACIACFGLEWVWSNGYLRLALLRMGANATGLTAWQPWRLLSHAFLHGSVSHLVLNMLAVLGFGTFFERVIGWRRFVLLYGLAALGGGLASAFTGPMHVSVGASGAIFGLMGAGVALVLRRQTLLPRLVVASLRPRLVGVTVLNAVMSFLPFIDWRAHAGGAAVGLALAGSGLLVRGLGGAVPAREPLLVRAGAVAMIALMALSLALALIGGRAWQAPPVLP
jgi:membrane associated rhomboid family serine protease